MKAIKIWVHAVALACIFLFGTAGVAIADSVTRDFTNCINDPVTPGAGWDLNTPKIVQVDGYASRNLQCLSYGFTIPVSARIDGIVVNVGRQSNRTNNGGSRDAAIHLIKGGVVGATDRSTTTLYTTSNVVEAHGTSSDLWGDSWSSAEINANDFGVALAVNKPVLAGLAHTVQVNSMSITVYYTLFSCAPPSNTPAGLSLTCVCDTFERASLQPSTIFGNDWLVSSGDATGVLPQIANQGHMRLTSNIANTNNAKVATVPAQFPAAGNYISVEFRNYAYSGSGGDGMALTLSDGSVPAQPGAYGGSLGYAQRTGVPGFAGGWLGVALDEYGNFQDPGEGRVGGPGRVYQSASMRGSGMGTVGYPFLRGTDSLYPFIDNSTSTVPSYGHFYQVIVDARANNGAGGAVLASLNRDTTGGGSSYTSLIPQFNVFAANAAQAQVPPNWQLSFTGSTGGAADIHEIGSVRICAQTVDDPKGGTLGGFNAIDESYDRNDTNARQGHLFTKLAGTDFAIDVAALDTSAPAQIFTSYVASAGQPVTIELIDDSGLASTSCNATPSACSTCTKTAVANQTLTFDNTHTGYRTSGVFNIPAAYARLIARMSDGTTTACSTDAFAVRPLSFSSVASTATNVALSGAPKFKAGTDAFTLSVTSNVANYTGTPKTNTAGMAANDAGWAAGSLSSTTLTAAVASILPGASISTGSYTYSELGNFRFLGYLPSNHLPERGIYDDTWTAVDQGTQGDCVVGSYSNALDANFKYGCLFGIVADTATFGRFVPDHFALVAGTVTPFSTVTPNSDSFTYMGQAALVINYQLEARNGANARVFNYSTILNGATGYATTLPRLIAEDQGALHQGCDLVSRIAGLPTPTWEAGRYTVPLTTTTFTRPTTPGMLSNINCAGTVANAGAGASGPFNAMDIGVAMNDADASAVISLPSAPGAPALNMNSTTTGDCTLNSSCTARRIGSTRMLYGRMTLSNAYGSELLPLQVPMEVQFWQGTGTGFVRNVVDSLTTVALPISTTLAGTPPASGALPAGVPANYFYPETGKNKLSSADTTVTLATTSMFEGRNALNFGAPGLANPGWLDIILQAPPHLLGQWGNCLGQAANGSIYDDFPCARARFEVYISPLIYRRENY